MDQRDNAAVSTRLRYDQGLWPDCCDREPADPLFAQNRAFGAGVSLDRRTLCRLKGGAECEPASLEVLPRHPVAIIPDYKRIFEPNEVCFSSFGVRIMRILE
ncbi:hypothetical protein BN10_590020 [Phycicoccus elongatus Lp2]|uniref:Uncharacterized protein n=1 Tax=Phycicoccus elongatus Lp2 TaxID=1193181 RepID=N0E0K2_9MICO|nr:hypothetical protein BN10_590020 [Phycicoccus elongatus Lp2]